MSFFSVNFWRLQVNFILLFFLVVNSFIVESQQIINLPKSNLCVNHTTSCSHQIPFSNTSEEICVLKRHDQNSSECMYESSRGEDDDASKDIGKFLLSTYLQKFNGYSDTAFNVTFFDIKWSRLSLRFYESGKTIPDICREFQVTEALPSDTVLFFDCPWKLRDIESKTYHFQYIAYPSDEDQKEVTRSFLFYVPPSPSIEDYVELKELNLFLIVDVSFLPKLRLIIQTAPAKYNITKYKVQLVRTWVDQNWVVMTKEVTALPNETHIYDEPCDTAYRPGIYNFSVEPIHPKCQNRKCAISKTPGILIANTGTPLLIGMVGTVLLIPILVAVYFYCFRSRVPIPTGPEVWKPPKVLLVYNPDYTCHVSNMIRFTKYLKTCHIDPMLDLFCIPTSDSKDPAKWYRKVFPEANYILVFASPVGPKSTEPHQNNPYLHLYKIAVIQLNEFLDLSGTELSKEKVVCVILPDCSSITLPKEVSRLRKFTLPDKLHDLLKHMKVEPQDDSVANFTAALESDEPLTVHPLLAFDSEIQRPSTDNHPIVSPPDTERNLLIDILSNNSPSQSDSIPSRFQDQNNCVLGIDDLDLTAGK